jgi:hypothetical protein
MRLSLIACTSSGKAVMSMDDGRIHSFTRLEKRLLTCFEGLNELSLDMLAWICVTRAMRSSVEIWLSQLEIWRAAIDDE